MKEPDKMIEKTYITSIGNMPDSKFKVMTIMILTGLEKRVKDTSETLHKEILKTSLINTINEI